MVRMVGGGQSSSSSTRALRNAAAGEIVEVQGWGRIMRSTAGRKDRHSKVCTARGPRDRRVRLAAHTAIQFYDVQDRLGYDRPSKAVDWLMKKAKSAIEALNQPPGSNPTATATATATTPDGEAYDSSLLPPSMESDSIADTIKSFFPMGGEGSSTASMQFQSYQSSDLPAGRDSNQSQDLKLSLQSFQDPIMIQSHQNQEEEQQSQFPGAAQIGFDNPSGGWNFANAGYGGGGGLMFIPPQASLQQHQVLFGHTGGGNTGHFFTQGGPLQSNYTPLATTVSSQVHHHHDPSVSGIGLISSAGFSSFRIPARIQGDEEEQDGNPNKPFTLSSGSRH